MDPRKILAPSLKRMQVVGCQACPGRRQEKHPCSKLKPLQGLHLDVDLALVNVTSPTLQPAGHGTRSGQFSGLRRQYRARSRNVLLRGRAHLDCVIFGLQRQHVQQNRQSSRSGRAILQDRQSAGRILPGQLQRTRRAYQLLTNSVETSRAA